MCPVSGLTWGPLKKSHCRMQPVLCARTALPAQWGLCSGRMRACSRGTHNQVPYNQAPPGLPALPGASVREAFPCGGGGGGAV